MHSPALNLPRSPISQWRNLTLMKRLAPLFAALIALLFCLLNSQGGAPLPSESSHTLFLIGFAVSLPFYLLPILTGLFTGHRAQFRTWLQWKGCLSFPRTVLYFLLFLLILETVFAVLPQIGTQNSVQHLATFSFSQRLILALPLCICIPFLEELLFRGLLLHSLPYPLALPLSSLLFAIAHGLNLFIIPLFLFGWFLALLTRRTQSLLPSILFHGLFNAITLFFA